MVVRRILTNSWEKHNAFQRNLFTHNYYYNSFISKEVVMADDKDTKYIPKSRFKLATQEDCNRINNGGATEIVLNRRVRNQQVISLNQ
jgi:hypothetical protein